MSRAADALPISPGQRETLEVLAQSTTAAYREVRRAQALLMAADGLPDVPIAAAVAVTPVTVRGWRARFAEEGLARFAEVREGRGRKPSIPAETVNEIVRVTLHEAPPGATHWSTRTMAARGGGQPGHRAPGLAGPGAAAASGGDVQVVHRSAVRGEARRRCRAVPEPAEKAVVLCLDEKSQVQALDRTQPSLPMKKGRAGTMTHDYKRNGTTTLFAALNVLTGAVIGQCLPRHRHDEFLVFLRRIQREVPRGLQVHVILDNYATHSHPDVEAWLAKHPRFHLHFTPTSSSWLNLVERWFRDPTDKRLRRGSFNSVADLIAAIEEYLAVHNENAKPFVCTATADSILAKVRRGRVALEKVVSQ